MHEAGHFFIKRCVGQDIGFDDIAMQTKYQVDIFTVDMPGMKQEPGVRRRLESDFLPRLASNSLFDGFAFIYVPTNQRGLAKTIVRGFTADNAGELNGPCVPDRDNTYGCSGAELKSFPGDAN